MAERTDRELLELAAKAAGIERGADRLDCGLSLTSADGRHRSLTQWNPLTKDGDALRLAVKLGLEVGRGIVDSVYAFRRHDCSGISEVLGSDPYAATRRVIVVAAAEIGAKE